MGRDLAPSEAIIAVTWQCNAKCGMCDIWKTKGKPQVEPSFYYHLPRSLKNVNITGGEPFMRKDLPEILMVITERCKRVRPVISTNGLLTERILETVPRLMALNSRTAIRVSLDGIGQTHDKIRGVLGAFDKALATLKGLKSLGVRDLGVGFTLVRGNETEMMQVHELARSMGIQFTSTVAHSSPIFFGDQENQDPDLALGVEAFSHLMRRQLKSLHPKNWFRAYFTEGVLDQIEGRPRRILCPALEAFFFLDPTGEVFPCHVLDMPIGNLAEHPFEELVSGHRDTLDYVRTCPQHCWMTCTVAPEMRKRPGKVVRWILSAWATGKIVRSRTP
jgi:MoaA/NifB/PqqE/SkfB family radical SAM enzyme